MSKDVWTRDEPRSPCQSLCIMHPEAGLCIGCLRTADEIAAWRDMNPKARQCVLSKLTARKPLIAAKRRAISRRPNPQS
ncbi:MAG: DUF1289 domain-containing protein [Rhodobacteraceae bacterium]|nr:DUF1289 domain-containing protein [Paracoccaceae bacterium]